MALEKAECAKPQLIEINSMVIQAIYTSPLSLDLLEFDQRLIHQKVNRQLENVFGTQFELLLSSCYIHPTSIAF